MNKGSNFLTFKLTFNDYYSQDISNKIKAVKHRKQEKGEYQAPFAPFGYKKDPNNKNHLIINEETAPVVRRIFELYLKGIGTPKISKILNDENIPSPSKYLPTERYKKCSHKWNKGAIYRILKENVYIGTVVGHKRYKVNHKVKTMIDVPKSEQYYVEDRHEPIIDKKTFEEVQTKLKNGNCCRERKNHNPLKKFVYCGYCGRKASLKTAKRTVKSGDIHTHHYFICGNKSDNYYNCENGTMTYSILLPLVKEQIKEECSKIVFSKGELTSLYEQARESLNSEKIILTRRIEKIEKEIEKSEKQLEQVYSDKMEGILNVELFSKFYNMYQKNKEENLKQLEILKKELKKFDKEKVVDYSYIKKIAEQCLNFENIEQNEELLNKLIYKIEYFKGKQIKIKYKFFENM